MAAKAKANGALVEVRGAVRRIQKQGEVLFGRIGKDAKALATKGRAELLREVAKVQKDLHTRVDKTVKELERTLLKRLHAATEERVGKLEVRVAELEQRMSSATGEGEDMV
jgi:hypothetical protein